VFDFLARSGEQFWVADQDGQLVGYARMILHDGVREFTEFFVLLAGSCSTPRATRSTSCC
jgi:hypothetical protein